MVRWTVVTLLCVGCGGGDEEREEKPEWLQRVVALGDRTEEIGTSATDSIDLGGVEGEYGYFVHFDRVPGATVGAGTLEVCVTSTGSTAVTYFPHFPPGFDFTDTDPGCTEITNVDPTLENDILVDLSGAGTATITTSLIP